MEHAILDYNLTEHEAISAQVAQEDHPLKFSALISDLPHNHAITGAEQCAVIADGLVFYSGSRIHLKGQVAANQLVINRKLYDSAVGGCLTHMEE